MQKKNWSRRKCSIFNGIAVRRKAGNTLHTPKSHDLAGINNSSIAIFFKFKTKNSSFETSPYFLPHPRGAETPWEVISGQRSQRAALLEPPERRNSQEPTSSWALGKGAGLQAKRQ